MDHGELTFLPGDGVRDKRTLPAGALTSRSATRHAAREQYDGEMEPEARVLATLNHPHTRRTCFAHEKGLNRME
jgi:hypothetical protein